MIDEINSDDSSDYIGGFPEHPHRGFQTITYMKAGRMRHREHMKNGGVIGAGDVQWMMAGAGVLHSEMPEQEQGLLHGFQRWLNLPAAQKMKPAQYQEILSKNITEQKLLGGGVVRVIAGNVTVNLQNQKGSLLEISTHGTLLDVTLFADEIVELSFNKEHPALVYVYKGETDGIFLRELGVYEDGDILPLKGGHEGVGFLVLSGEPINEPIVQYGPFVMNTQEEIDRAISDFRNPQYLCQLASGKHANHKNV